MKTYISGKITGLELQHAEQLFADAEKALIKSGNTPVNPMKLTPFHPDITYKDYMLADIKALFECEAIFMLQNWKESKGARIEHTIAIEMGLHIHYQY